MARRRLVWTRFAPAISSLTRVTGAVGGAIETQDLLQQYRIDAGITRGPVGLTAVRIRLHLSWYAGVADDVTSFHTLGGLYYGVKVADFNDVVTQDAAEAPGRGPQLSPHDDWMAWGRVPPKAYTSNAGFTAPSSSIGWEEVDVRSMRRIDELGQTLVLQVQGTLPTVGANPAVVVSSSVLLALP